MMQIARRFRIPRHPAQPAPDGHASPPRSRLRRTGRRLWFDRAAIGAVEFALIAPFLLMLYLGGSELAIAVTINRKVHHTASTVNDLVTQTGKIDREEIDGIFRIASSIIEPYDASGLRIKITSVAINAEGQATVAWSHALGVPKNNKGDAYTLPAEFSAMRSQSLVVATTYYDYTPLGGYGIKTPIAMGETAYLQSRVGSEVVCSDCS